VRTAGVRRVTGGIVGDESMFDGIRGVPSSYGAPSPDVEPLSALTYRRNVYGGRYVRAPATNAAAALRLQLKIAGVRVDNGAAARRTPVDAAEVARLNGLTLRTLVARTNTPSDNFYAETLIRDLGALRGTAGSTAAGARVVRSEAAKLGAGPAVVDGSGLSRRDRSSPQQVVTLLRAMRGDSAFRASLPTAGRTGTLATRMRWTPASGRCRAKTGTLRDVSALAGYCTTTSGRTLAFAILMNAVYPATARSLQDKMAVAMVRYG
jgi:serine-type D-Ala-D-Ala carboxypeptidase/endopeptidase (penicillin-binding protein 4)